MRYTPMAGGPSTMRDPRGRRPTQGPDAVALAGEKSTYIFGFKARVVATMDARALRAEDVAAAMDLTVSGFWAIFGRRNVQRDTASKVIRAIGDDPDGDNWFTVISGEPSDFTAIQVLDEDGDADK